MDRKIGLYEIAQASVFGANTISAVYNIHHGNYSTLAINAGIMALLLKK